MWTPHSLLHSTLIALLVLSPLWFTWRSGYTRTELGLAWPPRRVTAGICAAGLAIAFIFPVGAVLAGNPLPADPTWPKLSNILPYFVWAIFQQFLLQSFIFLRMESAVGSKRAVIVSSAFFTFAHLPNWPLPRLRCSVRFSSQNSSAGIAASTHWESRTSSWASPSHTASQPA